MPEGTKQRRRTAAAGLERPKAEPERRKAGPRVKPAKPYAGFPLFPHATGRWAKKVRGRFAFFGPWEDPQGALERWLVQKDALLAGMAPRATAGNTSERDGVTLRDLVNHFLTAKQRRMESGEMGRRSFSDYHVAAGKMIDSLGKHRLAIDVTPDDFGLLRSDLAKTLGPVALGNTIGRVRSIFKHGFEAGLIPSPVRFGLEFAKPPKRAMRHARNARGERMFTPNDIRALLELAGTQLRAMILLGLNCGMGNTDVASLPRTSLDLRRGLLDFPRPKTGVPRRCPLWPETVAALRAAAKVRPDPADVGDADLVFVTKYGRPWVRVAAPKRARLGARQAVTTDSVLLEFGKLRRAAGIKQVGLGFYALRHTFRTIADEVRDRPAVDLIMGHENGQDIATHYVERISNERLQRVTDHVRRWALGSPRAARGV